MYRKVYHKDKLKFTENCNETISNGLKSIFLETQFMNNPKQQLDYLQIENFNNLLTLAQEFTI